MDTTEQLAQFVESITKQAFEDGRVQGRQEMRDQLRSFFDKFDETFPVEGAGETQKKGRGPARMTSEAIQQTILGVIDVFADRSPDGASINGITAYLQESQTPIEPHDIRHALKQLQLSGQIRRIERNRYLPVEPTVDPVIAEQAAE